MFTIGKNGPIQTGAAMLHHGIGGLTLPFKRNLFRQGFAFQHLLATAGGKLPNVHSTSMLGDGRAGLALR